LCNFALNQIELIKCQFLTVIDDMSLLLISELIMLFNVHLGEIDAYSGNAFYIAVKLCLCKGADYVHQSAKITAKLQSPIGDSSCAVKITDR